VEEVKKNDKKFVDKPSKLCYNSINERRKELIKMRYRAVDLKGYYFPHYFKTKKEALAFISTQKTFGLERKIGGSWFPCH
jgi:hypothetical protein